MIIGIAGNAGVGKDTVADHLVKNHGCVKVSLADPLKRICRDVFNFSEDQLWGPSEKRNEPDRRYPRTYAVAVPEGSDYVLLREDGTVKPKAEWPVLEYLTPRHALQQLGTQWGRSCYPDIWVDYALRVAQALLKGSATQATKYEAPTYEDWEHPGYDPRVGLEAWRVRTKASIAKGVVIPDVRFNNEVEAIRAAGGEVWKITRPIPRLEGAAGQHQSETELDGIDPKLFHAFIENSATLEKLYQSVEFCLEKK